MGNAQIILRPEFQNCPQIERTEAKPCPKTRYDVQAIFLRKRITEKRVLKAGHESRGEREVLRLRVCS